MPVRVGTSTLRLDQGPVITGFAAVGGKREMEGPLGPAFDLVNEDTTFGEKTWEKAESRLQKDAVNKALDKTGLSPSDIQYIFAGDLLSQCIGSNFGLREFGIPFIGIYGACSTMAEGLGLAAVMVEAGAADACVAVTSSHFCSAERQFRFPLEYGGQRPQSSQWTATAAGCTVVTKGGIGPVVRHVTFGRMVDYGIKDQNNMGAAMAPAAADTIHRFFEDTDFTPDEFDLILTGDLGAVGSELCLRLLEDKNLNLRNVHNDCGLLIYDRDTQDVHSGGSGCGCAASVLCAHILPKLLRGELKNVLLIATGALHSAVSVGQTESIPGVAHLVHITTSPPEKG